MGRQRPEDIYIIFSNISIVGKKPKEDDERTNQTTGKEKNEIKTIIDEIERWSTELSRVGKGNFTPSLPQNRTWESPLIRLVLSLPVSICSNRE